MADARAAAEAFNRLVAENETAAVAHALALQEAFSRSGVTYGGAPMRSFLRPHLVSRRDWAGLRDSGRRLLECAARVARQVFGGDLGRLLDFLGTPEAERPWLEIDPGEPDVLMSRIDAFLTEAGPRVIEINSDAPAGFGYGDRMASLFAESDLHRRFAALHPLRYVPSAPGLVGAFRRRHAAAGGNGTPRLAIVDWADVKTRPDQELLRESFLRSGLDCRLADPREVELRGDRLFAGGVEIDLVYRRVLLQELLERPSDARSLLTAYRARPAAFQNSFRCRLSEDKAFLAILSDDLHAALLRPEERELVRRVVPWTRRVAEGRTTKDGTVVDLVPWVLARREALVLKPAHGYGGASVVMGDEASDGEWQARVVEALGAPWVVQERARIPQEPFPVVSGGTLAFEALKVNVNPFYVAGAEVGAVARVSRSSVINVSAGGGSVPTFVLED
ncbi:MAG: hypothetical protein AB7O37_08505 [Vicinamibacteria bacterium]